MGITELGPNADIVAVYLYDGTFTKLPMVNANWKYTNTQLRKIIGVTHIHRFVNHDKADTYIANRLKAFKKGKS